LIQALIFDFDGTLVDSDPIKRSAFYDVTTAIPGAAEFLDTIFTSANPGDRYEIFAKLAAWLELDSADDWTKAYGMLCQNRILDLLASSGIGQTLATLTTNRYRLFIASATPQNDLISLVNKSPLTEYFTGVYGRPTAKVDILRDILRSHDWVPQEIVMIGNSELDLQAAVTVGCPFVGVVDRSEENIHFLPEFSLHSLDDLPGIIDHLNTTMPKRASP
jgi:phosphoglycolate phosphatase